MPANPIAAEVARLRAELERLRADLSAMQVREFERKLEALASVAGLRSPERSGSLKAPMTGAQLQKRGEAIAASRADTSKDPLLLAIKVSKWKSLRRYAKHLGVSPGTLINWRDGIHVPTEANAARVKRELGVTLPLKN